MAQTNDSNIGPIKNVSDEISKSYRTQFVLHEAKGYESPIIISKFNKYQSGISALDLSLQDIDPVEFWVQELIPRGLTFIAGVPKCGKTVLSQQIALSVGNGSRLFKIFEAKKSDVLLISLEDGYQSIHARLLSMAQVYSPCDAVKIYTKWGNDLEENLNRLRTYLKDHRETRLVIIDTFALFCRSDKKRSYNSEYTISNKIKEIADSNEIAILVIHHITKRVPKDWVGALYGTHGATGAADSIIYLERQRGTNKAKLHVTGRNVEDGVFFIKFDPSFCVWTLEEFNPELDLHPERREIYDILVLSNKPMGLSEIASRIGKSNTSVQNLLHKMIKLNLVIKVKHGVYAAVSARQNMSPIPESTDPVDLMNSLDTVDLRYLWS